MSQTKFLLDESRMPRHWYNIMADLPVPLPPPTDHWTVLAEPSSPLRTTSKRNAGSPFCRKTARR